jgi:superfamily I DNA/RNA helicase
MSLFTLDQQKAITFFSKYNSEKPHLVIEAGAGAGKTQVLTERVKWLVQNNSFEKRIRPEHLFLVTFTNDAQAELKERVEQLLPSANIHISTIDSLFALLVDCIFPSYWETKHDKSSSIPPKISLIPENAAARKMEQSLLQFLSSNQIAQSDLELIVDFILAGGFKKSSPFSAYAQSTMDTILKCMCQDTFLAADQDHIRIASKHIHPATSILLGHIHSIARSEYHARLSQGEMTYADRTVFLKENLTQGLPFILKELIVDEYQDTNQIQHEILFRIVQKSQARMIVVGDPKQSIYGFRGASVDVFKNLTCNPSWNHILLNQNFRSESALLEQINLLSRLTFDWSDPKTPKEYENSFFYKQAEKKYIPSSDLIPKTSRAGMDPAVRPRDDIKNHVHIVGASISSGKETKLKLKEYALHAYCDFLKKFQYDQNARWSDIVILCEKNSQIQDFIPILQAHHIPIANYDEHLKNESTEQEDLVALALCKYLTNEHNKIDLYLILNSPLSACDCREIELFFSQQIKSDSIHKILDCMEQHRQLAKDHFFLAWQMLRWKLVTLHEKEESKKNAFVFCSHMDFFSHALFEELKNPNTRMQMEIEGSFFPLPENLKNWTIEKMTHHPLSDADGVELKTVHGAKGLQWPHVCFYPKHGKHHTTGEFILAQSETHLDVTWLNTDTEKLSMVKRIENKKFEHDDFHMEKEKPIWFSLLRKHSEEDFERQRVFYTAFTRAQKNLILFQPVQAGNAKNGILNSDKKSKKSLSEKEDYLEKEVYKKYLLAQEQKADIIPYDSAFCFDFIPEEAAQQISTESIYDIELTFSKIEKIRTEDQDLSIDNRFEDTLFLSLQERIEQKKSQTNLIHKGIVYHAAAENKRAAKRSVQSNLEESAEQVWHELEIWQKSDLNSMDSSRHIIDLVLLFSKEKFIILFPEFTDQIQYDHIIFVVDFKTGQKEEKHENQIKTYLTLIQSAQYGITNLNANLFGGIFYSKDNQWKLSIV